MRRKDDQIENTKCRRRIPGNFPMTEKLAGIGPPAKTSPLAAKTVGHHLYNLKKGEKKIWKDSS